MKSFVCWLDFGYQNLYSTNPHDLGDWLKEAGFSLSRDTGTYGVWTSEKIPDVVLEVLNVDGIPEDPVSEVAEVNASVVDQDRRRVCVPQQMDPFFRCMLYSTTDGAADEAAAHLRNLFAAKEVHCLWQR